MFKPLPPRNFFRSSGEIGSIRVVPLSRSINAIFLRSIQDRWLVVKSGFRASGRRRFEGLEPHAVDHLAQSLTLLSALGVTGDDLLNSSRCGGIIQAGHKLLGDAVFCPATLFYIARKAHDSCSHAVFAMVFRQQ